MSLLKLPRFSMPGSRTRNGWIGIDLGCHSLKLAQLQIVQGRKQITDASIVPLPDSAQLTAESLRTGWLTQLLRRELQLHRQLTGQFVACSLSMSVTEYRTLEIPPGSEKERREMIGMELSESVATGEVPDFDFWDSDAGNEPGSTVNVLSASPGLAEGIVESLSQVGLYCRVLDGSPFALARSTELLEDDHQAHPIALLDWGYQTAHLVVISQGQPVFSRMLKDCGGAALIAGVSRGLGLSHEDCHQLLVTCGIANPLVEHSERTELQELVQDFVGDPLHQLAAELNKTFSYLGSQRPELLPEEIWLAGGGATIHNIDAWLRFETGLPVSKWRIPLKPSVEHSLEGNSVELLAQAAALSELGWRS